MFRELLRWKSAGIIELTSHQIETLDAHYEFLLRWNRVLNLTSVHSAEEAVERHYCESLFLAAHLPAGPLRIADIGSGAGFPGIPVAVVRPESSVTLIESHQRKSVFLREATRELSNVHVLSKRAETLDQTFDHVVSRAVSYEDLAAPLNRIARAADLLTGREAPPLSLSFRWEEPILLPWGKNRFLRMGVSRETVSRETKKC